MQSLNEIRTQSLRRTNSLQLRQLIVHTLPLHQLVMPPLLHNFAGIKHINHIRMLDCTKAMRNSYCRAALGRGI
jgi:hypothetical protein